MSNNNKNYEKISYPGGVYLIRGFFTANEFEDLFRICDAHEERNKNKFLAANEGRVLNMLFNEIPSLKKKFEKTELKDLLSEVSNCSSSDLVISEHSDYHINTLGGWHDDIEGRNYCSYEDAESAGIYKFGIFLADPSIIKNIGTQFKINNKLIRPKMKLGDILLFPVGVKHRGYPGKFTTAIIRKFVRFFNLEHTKILEFIKEFFKEPNRRAIFFTFGKESEVFRIFEKNNIERALDQIKYLPKH
tara:strand:+ start:1047 stop:1784 length:738 start_codon:yes stop_codon:yes gene_type:complete